MVAGTESNALPLFAPQAPPLATGTTGTLEWPCKDEVCILTGRPQVVTVLDRCVVCDLHCAVSKWFLLDPAVRRHATSALDHWLKGCELLHVPQTDS